MAKFIADISFTAHVEIEAKDAEEARAKAQDILDARSVYEDDRIDTMHDEAFCAGGTGDDPPLKKKKAYSMRDPFFEADDPIVRLEPQED